VAEGKTKRKDIGEKKSSAVREEAEEGSKLVSSD